VASVTEAAVSAGVAVVAAAAAVSASKALAIMTDESSVALSKTASEEGDVEEEVGGKRHLTVDRDEF